jgi:hypothetical protein
MNKNERLIPTGVIIPGNFFNTPAVVAMHGESGNTHRMYGDIEVLECEDAGAKQGTVTKFKVKVVKEDVGFFHIIHEEHNSIIAPVKKNQTVSRRIQMQIDPTTMIERRVID